MATIIYFKKEERLAILKILIDINNNCFQHDNKGIKFIENVANFIATSNEISEAYIMPRTDAQNIIANSVEKDGFIHYIIQYMLCLEKDNNRFNHHLYSVNLITEKIKFRYSFQFSDRWANPLDASRYHIIKEDCYSTVPSKETLYKDL